MVTVDVYRVEQERDLVEAIGKVTIRWAAFDYMLMEIAGVVLDNRDAAVDLIFGQQGAGRARVETFDRMIGGSKLEEFERTSLLELTGQARKMLSVRNDIVHSPLVTSIQLQGTKFAYVTEKMGRKGSRQEFRTKDVFDHLQDISRLLIELENTFLIFVNKYVQLPEGTEPYEENYAFPDRR